MNETKRVDKTESCTTCRTIFAVGPDTLVDLSLDDAGLVAHFFCSEICLRASGAKRGDG